MPGIAESIRAAGIAKGIPTAALSRGLAGVDGNCLVVNLPGSRGGVKDGLACSSRCSAMRSNRSWGATIEVGWPAADHLGEVRCGPIEPSDQVAWRSARRRNADWLTPVGCDRCRPAVTPRPPTFRPSSAG